MVATNDNMRMHWVTDIVCRYPERFKVDPAGFFASRKVETTISFERWLAPDACPLWFSTVVGFRLHRLGPALVDEQEHGPSELYMNPWLLAYLFGHELQLKGERPLRAGQPIYSYADGTHCIVSTWHAHRKPVFDVKPTSKIDWASGTLLLTPLSRH